MKHIKEVDGLRAVAVMAVLLFHAGFASVKGGFVGVDAFFVISGYLITQILVSELDGGSLSLARFYTRRIFRIVPALYMTLLASVLVFFVVLPPVLATDLVTSFSAAILSVSNLWFFATVDYFSDQSANPVLHTWSLAVEEQFYLFFPLFLLAIARLLGRRSLPKAIGGVFLGSLGAASYLAFGDSSQAFYLPWLRAWELLAGSLLAIAPIRALDLRWKRAFSNVGLIAVGLSCVVYDDQTVFPGLAAILPVAGAAAVIAGAGSASLANRLLASRPMVWTGKISYSLYLVHWPIFCLASLFIKIETGFWARPALLSASFLLASLSFSFVESPARKLTGRIPQRRVFAGFALSSGALLILVLAAHGANRTAWGRFPEAVEMARAFKQDKSFFKPGTCFLDQRSRGFEAFQKGQCLAQTPGRSQAVVVGDSHAANVVAALAELNREVSVLQATASGCRPTLDTDGPPRCSKLVDHVYREWLPGEGREVGTVVLIGRWKDNDVEPLRRTIAHLHTLQKRVVLVGPAPEFLIPVPLILAYEGVLSVDLRHRLFRTDRVELDRKLRAEFGSKVTYHSAIDQLCPAGECRMTDRSQPTLFDRDHFTPAGARLAMDGMRL
ncbi:MAG: acyltransferase [Deltaproteobacteria bacterium]|nr:acyltransferase [Deltaproteobacteria bacterium]